MRDRRQGWLWMVSHADACFDDHRDIIGTIADRHCLVSRQTKPIASLHQHVMLDYGINDSSLCRTRELAVSYAQHIGLKPIESDLFSNGLYKSGEAAGHEDRLGTPCSHGPNQRHRTGVRPDPFDAATVNDCLVQPFQ